mgnify:CR=1 FL=1
MKVYALVRNAEKANTIFEGCVGISDLTYVIADLEKDELYTEDSDLKEIVISLFMRLL